MRLDADPIRVLPATPVDAAAQHMARRAFALCLASLLIAAASTLFGSSGPLWSLGDSASEVWWDSRLPRAALGLTVGGLLAVAGTVMQALLRNPLAEPYLFGTSSGAAVGAIIALAAGGPTAWAGWVELGAFVGALAAISVVVALAASRGFDEFGTVLVGVAIAALLGAVAQVLLTALSDRALRGTLFWLMGDLGDPSGLPATATALAIALAAGHLLGGRIDAMAYGAVQARNLGVDVRSTRLLGYLLVALCAAFAVSHAGAVGFVGLAAPHVVRLWLGADARVVLPVAACVGAAMVCASDAVARSLLAPVQLPVGAFTTALGVPVLLHALLSTRRGRA